MNNVEALKALYEAFGGNAVDVANMSTNAEVINALAELAAATGGTLPAVTDADDGKVLTVVDGVWDKAAASGKPTMVLYKIDDETGDTIINMSFEDVYALALAGYPVFMVNMQYGDDLYVYHLARILRVDTPELDFESVGGGSVYINSDSAYDPDLHL